MVPYSVKIYDFYTCSTTYKNKGGPNNAPHIFYYFQHAIYRVQKVRSSIVMCSKFIILLIKYTDPRFLRPVYLKYW
jgi:hypothetical protein